MGFWAMWDGGSRRFAILGLHGALAVIAFRAAALLAVERHVGGRHHEYRCTIPMLWKGREAALALAPAQPGGAA